MFDRLMIVSAMRRVRMARRVRVRGSIFACLLECLGLV